MDAAPAVAVRGLTVRYGGRAAVDGLDLTVGRGEVVGLLGPNGAGKTTTLRVLTGRRRPDAGSAAVGGRDVVRRRAAVKPLVGFVPDRDDHFDELTGRRNLLIYAGLYGVP